MLHTCVYISVGQIFNQFNGVCFFVFLIIQQVWLSNDGGNQFDQVLILYDNETIEHCYVDMHGGKVIFTSNLHKLYFGNAGTCSIIKQTQNRSENRCFSKQPSLYRQL